MSGRADRYVAFLDRNALAVLLAVALALAGSVYLIAFHLPIRADYRYLLPEDSPSIGDLKKLEARMPAKDSTLVLLVAPDPPTRERAGADLLAGLRTIGPELIERLEVDDAETRTFLRANAFLYVPLADLALARDALKARLARANPLFVDLDEEDPAVAKKRLDELRGKKRDAEARLARSGYVSADGLVQLAVVRTSFRATDVPKDKLLIEKFTAVFDAVRAAHPGVQIGLAGGVPNAVAEHDAVAGGILISSIATFVLVGFVLLVHLRSPLLLGLLTVQIAAATLLSFGVAALAVGHLNAATAFLGAIIAGNGVNYGILLVARYLEEDTTQRTKAVATAIRSTLVPTLVASFGASIAYGALAMTDFRGFSDFAIIGGLGMLVCWLVCFSLLPLLLLRFGRPPKPTIGTPIFGRIVVAAFASGKPRLVFGIATAVTVAAGIVTAKYIADDPYEYDMKKIRSDGAAAVEAQRWMDVSNAAFGRGVVGRTYFAVDRREDVEKLVATLRDLRDNTEDGRATIGQIQSILDAVPLEQDKKLELLDEIRKLLDKVLPKLDDSTSESRRDREELGALRPPDSLKVITDADLPAELAEPFREIDGRMGLVVATRPAATFVDFDGKAMLRFAHIVRPIPATKSGTSLVFADILDVNRRDLPIVTATAAIGIVLMVLLIVGRNRRALAVLAATGAGSLAMVAICALVGLRINFLDFVALPIALGLGIDYAINVAHRADGEDARATLRTTGGTVFVCSLTTMIGYATLLVSHNRAIRDFGYASLIGEITTVIAALALVPVLITLGRRRREATTSTP